MEMQFTSGQFHADMFLMANNVKGGYKKNADTTTLPKTEYVIVQEIAGNDDVRKLQLSDPVIAPSDVHVRGYKVEGSDTTPQNVAAGKVILKTNTEPNADAILYVNADDFKLGDTVDVTYEVTHEAGYLKEILVDNRSTAIGEVICKWPVYGSSDVCTDSAIRGYVIMKIFKARVTAMPGFDTSYKSAATNQITLSAMDAKREDGAVYSIAYIDSADYEQVDDGDNG